MKRPFYNYKHASVAGCFVQPIRAMTLPAECGMR
jgi:hypothetical protein